MSNSTAVFTICSNNYLAQAGVFFRSAADHLPGADLYLGLADVPDEASTAPGNVTVMRADELGIPEFRRVAFGYDIMEFNTAIKPFMFLRLFERGYANVIYFDPDIMIFSSLDRIFEVLDERSSFVLTPHLCSPPGVDAPRTERHIMQTGVFNLGFLACSAQAETEKILRWWARKLLHDCVNDQAAGLFVDQKFMDLVPGFADRAVVLRDTTMNVAYWNLAQRRFGRTASGWSVDGHPLGFFHFSGFDPQRPERLSKHVEPARLDDALYALLADYAAKLLAEPRPPSRPYAYGTFASGTPIHSIDRQIYREHQPVWSGDPFQTYEAYLRRPSRHAALGQSGEIVTNLMKGVHDRSSELRAMFDLNDRRGVSNYAKWFAQHTDACR